ncbi:MAG: lipopolysaccharide exporter [Thermoleophilaceae bacterium]|nr:lipopolysaccharide exporter [Thermoleophilaceae bacterium]
MASERFSFPRPELRRRTARGAVVNGGFLLLVESVTVVQSVVVARLLSTSSVGLYGIVSVTVMTLLTLKQVGIDEQYVQQDEADQELAFQRAFTIELVLSGVFALLVAALAPAIAALYGSWRLAPLMLALAYLPLAFALQSPAWVFFRRMDFVRQRGLQAIVPLATFAATVTLVALGMGVWGLVLGALVGNSLAAWAAIRVSPYPLRLRLHGPSVRRYARFSWPILVAAVAGLAIRQGQLFAFNAKLGLAGAGFITLAATLTRYADRADQAVTATIYPAICAVKDERRSMTELFTKSNRLTAMWALPFGAALALFAPDLVRWVLGEKWAPATILLQVLGVTTGVHQLGFNWTAFYRAVGISRPQAVYALACLAAFCAVPIPLFAAFGIKGFAYGMFAVMAAASGTRFVYVKRLLPDVRLAALVARAATPVVVAAGMVLLWRLADGGGRGPAEAAVQLAVFIAVYLTVTWLRERELLAEVAGYLRVPPPVQRAPA